MTVELQKVGGDREKEQNKQQKREMEEQLSEEGMQHSLGEEGLSEESSLSSEPQTTTAGWTGRGRQRRYLARRTG